MRWRRRLLRRQRRARPKISVLMPNGLFVQKSNYQRQAEAAAFSEYLERRRERKVLNLGKYVHQRIHDELVFTGLPMEGPSKEEAEKLLENFKKTYPELADNLKNGWIK